MFGGLLSLLQLLLTTPLPPTPICLPLAQHTRMAESYAGQQVLTCATNSSTEAAVQAVHAGFDVMGAAANTIDVRAKTASERQHLEKLLGACTVKIPDVEAAVRAFEQDLRQSRAAAGNEWFQACVRTCLPTVFFVRRPALPRQTPP